MHRFRINRVAPCGTILMAVLAAVLLTLPAMAQPEPQPIPAAAGVEVGQPFPVMLLPRIDTGRPDTIVNYRGQKLIMHIFASW